jgi:predicted amino acid racemase
MYLQKLLDRNPTLLETALELHQSGRVPPNTWVVDLDTIAANARALAAEARRLGLSTYLMTKQHGRNPYVTLTALANGLDKTVAVDLQCALLLRRYGAPVGHMGHLNQIPRRYIAEAVAMRPDVITVFSLERARWIDEAARAQGVVQDLLIRVHAEGDVFFGGQEGGFAEPDVAHVARDIRELEHVRLVGTTAFPCVVYDADPDAPHVLSPNAATVARCAQTLRALGFEVTQVNMPGNTSTLTMPMLVDAGATHVEPGHGLLGTAPVHADRDDLPEAPAYTYVSEISHHVDARAYAFGGGLFRDIYREGTREEALVGSNFAQARENAVEYVAGIPQIIDYHAVLEDGARCHVGDTALFGFRTQMQMTRSYIAPVSGLASGEPRLHALFDHANTALDEHFDPIDPVHVRADIDRLLARDGMAKVIPTG